MKAFSYLILMSIKNNILLLKKKLAMLILYIFIFASLIFSTIVNLIAKKGQTVTIKPLSLNIFYIIIAVIALSIFYINLIAGLQNGSTLFDMADVNHVFIAPISKGKVLFYGTIKQVGKILFSSIFIIYQLPTLVNQLNFSTKEIIFLFVLLILLSFTSQLSSMGIYMFSNGNQLRKRIMKMFITVISAAFLLYIYLVVKSSKQTILDSLFSLPDRMDFQLIPIVGWSVMLIKSIVENNIINIFLSISLFLITIFAFILRISMSKREYYEDVLVSTEIIDKAMKAIKNKEKTYANPYSKNKIKVKDKVLGLNKGKAASIIYYKQVLEARRTSKIMWFDAFSLIIAFIVIVISYYLKVEYLLYIILAMLIYLQLVINAMFGLNLELSNHYIFLIPDKSLNKVIYLLLKPFIKALLDGFLFFFIVFIIAKEDILTCIFSILSYALLEILVKSLYILYQRILKGKPNLIARLFVSTMIIGFVIAPLFVGTIILLFTLPVTIKFLSLMPIILGSIFVIALIVVTCGNLFDKLEYI